MANCGTSCDSACLCKFCTHTTHTYTPSPHTHTDTHTITHVWRTASCTNMNVHARPHTHKQRERERVRARARESARAREREHLRQPVESSSRLVLTEEYHTWKHFSTVSALIKSICKFTKRLFFLQKFFSIPQAALMLFAAFRT